MTLPEFAYPDQRPAYCERLALKVMTFAQLESIWCDCQVTGDYDLQLLLIDEMLTRPDAAPQDYELIWEMQDAGWNGGGTQEDRDAR